MTAAEKRNEARKLQSKKEALKRSIISDWLSDNNKKDMKATNKYDYWQAGRYLFFFDGATLDNIRIKSVLKIRNLKRRYGYQLNGEAGTNTKRVD